MPSNSSLASWCGLPRAKAVIPCTKSNTDSRRPAFLVQHGGDDLLRLRSGETALAQEALAIFVASGDYGLARSPNTGDERRGR